MFQDTLFMMPQQVFTPLVKGNILKTFDKLILKLEEGITHNRRPVTQRMTPKRARELESRLKHAHLLRFYQTCYTAYRDHLDKDTLPETLKPLTKPIQVETLLWHSGFPKEVRVFRARYEPFPELAALGWTMADCEQAYRDLIALTDLSEYAMPDEDQLRLLELDLVGCDIQGYYPTPPGIAQDLIHYARLTDGLTVLEPSAGKGNICDAICASGARVQLTAIEPQYRLREILNFKGYEVVDYDFLEHQKTYDRIIMNPPFENGEDMAHVIHAHDHLNPNGRLVSIMNAAVFWRKGKKYDTFRQWFDLYEGQIHYLPDNAFDCGDRPTKVKTCFVVMDK